MSRLLDLWLTRVYRAAGAALVLLACAVLAYTAGDRHWPYRVRRAELLTPVVAPGGSLRQTRVIDYVGACEIRIERRLQSTGPDGRRVMLDPIVFSLPPWDRDGLPQTVETPVPADFPCGPAALVDSPSAACNWAQRLLYRQHAAPVVTPFRVACPR